MTDSSLATHLKNLNAQIKYNQVGIASWGGQKNFKKSELPTVDFLLNNASKLDKQQNLRSKMVDEYLKKERVPIIRNGREYKFHNIPDPVLDMSTEAYQLVDPQHGILHNVNIPPEEFESFIATKNDIISEIRKSREDYSELLSGAEKMLVRDEQTVRTEISILEGEKDELEKRLADPLRARDELRARMKTHEPRVGQKKVKNNRILLEMRDELRLIMQEKEDMEREIDDIDNQLDAKDDELRNILRNKEDLKNRFVEYNRNSDLALENLDITIARIKNRLSQNKQISDKYLADLNQMNSGAFNASKSPTETDEEYLIRLSRMADVPFDDANTQNLAIMDQKNQLRENLLELIREKSLIEGVVNGMQNTNFLDIFTLNKTFQLFKTKFLKKYGFDNKNVELADIIQEIDKFIEKLNEEPQEQNQLVPYRNLGDMRRDPTEVEQAMGYEPQEESQSFRPFPRSNNPLLPSLQSRTASQASYDLTDFNGDQEEDVEDVIMPQQSSSSSSNIVFTTPKLDGIVSNPYTLQIQSKINGESIYFRYKIGTKENKLKYDKFIDSQGVLRTKGNKSSVVFEKTILLYSFDGNVGSFRKFDKLTSSSPYVIISNRLGLGEEDIFKIFSISSSKNKANVVQDLLKKMIEIGIQPSPEEGFIITKNSATSGIVGEGLEKDKKDKKVKFGDIVIMPNKLFYDNVLSISRPDGVKINGFKNKRVSDDFVVCLVKLFEKRNDYHSELNKLSSVERVLLDNLLSVANLHKKIITGSGNDSINKLKNDLQILEGEIQAGNNNESLKKKLHDILHKLAYFKVISLSQATKHYKDYIKNFF